MTLSPEIASVEHRCPEERLLLREFSHRINNECAAAIGAISIAAARSGNGEVKSTLRAVEDQLHHYAQVHHALQMPEHFVGVDAAAYLRRLCQAISRAKLDSRGIELVLVERSFLMDSERCWRLGLIVSELVTNSARHAFGENGGSICVELFPGDLFIKCRVTDNGVGRATCRPGRGLGIVHALAKSLGGRIDWHFGPKGAMSVLIFPVND
jgi:two-component sensor histidine kinase